MTEIFTMIGIENATKVIAWVLAFISVSAITVSLVTEGLKSIKWINRFPTKLVCYVVAISLTTPMMLALMAYKIGRAHV